MRKRKPSAPRTVRRRSESGSIALEASLVLPVVLMAVIFFICLIRASAVQMALHGAVSQTVRQAAANIHPIDLAVRNAGSGEQTSTSGESPAENDGIPVPLGEPPAGSGDTQATSGTVKPLPAVNVLADKLESWLPSPSGPLLAAALRGDWKSIQDTAIAAVGRPVIEPMLREAADKAVLDPERLSLSKLSLPDLKDRSDLSVAVEAEYSFKLGFPFTRKTIVLTDRAEERVWTPDPLPAPRLDGVSDPEHAPIQIVLIEPAPARPGNKARVVVRTTPGRELSVKVLYKSGRSVARHLGDTVTDDKGMADWTWLVSGNTTPGIWEIVVTASDGTSAARHFVVQKKTGKAGDANG